jgi:hypothetical protein
MYRINVRTARPTNRSELDDYEEISYKEDYFNLDEDGTENWNGYYIEVDELAELVDLLGEVKISESSFEEADFTAIRR